MSGPRTRAVALSLIVLAGSALPGCVTLRPWERGALMQRVMNDVAHPLEAAMEVHVLRTREAMAGAESAGGVSCGCN
jgi:hypothetical protein